MADGLAVVTGASRGIGRAVALEFLARGYEVLATVRTPQAGRALAEAAGPDADRLRSVQLDITAPGEFAYPSHTRFLVNNAGYRGPYLAMEDATGADWRPAIETNIIGTVEMIRRVIPVLRTNGGGTICNVTSSSLLIPMPFFGIYRATKAAISALGETLRSELEPFGIRVVEIMPGAIDTDMARESVIYRAPEAAQNPVYAERAQRLHGFSARAAGTISSAKVAAREVVDVVTAAEDTLRHGCDEGSRALLATWRESTDEQMMRPFIAQLRGD